MEKRSMISSGIILLCVASLLWDYVELLREAREIRQDTIQRTAIRVAEQMDALSKITDPVVLRENLDLLQKQEKIGFYIIKNQRAPAMVSLPDFISPDFAAVVDGQVRLILDPESEAPQAAYAGEKFGGDEIVIGKFIDRKFMERLIAYNRGNFWRHFFVQALILIGIILYSFRELKTLLQSMQWGTVGAAGGTGGAAFKFQETSSIARALDQVSQLQAQSQEDLERLRTQILPAAQNELQSKQEPPYEFECIMVRVDINNSTAVYSDKNLIEVQRHWFDYFKVHCGEIAGRYKGFVHEELGDEVILFFKVHDYTDLATAARVAVATVRDIFRLTETIDLQTQKKFNFPFRVKATVDQGPLRVYKSSFRENSQQGRLKIEGAGGESRNPFLTTVRMFKFVEDKTVNACILSQQLYQEVEPLVSVSRPIDHSVPNMQDKQSYHLVTGFTEWSEKSNLSQFFLTDDILVHALDCVLDPSLSPAEKLNKINLVRGVPLREASINLQESLIRTLEFSLQSTPADDGKILASLVALTPQIISSQNATEKTRQLLASCLTNTNERVQANAIEAWGKLDFKTDQIKKTLKVFRHNRSLANAIIASLTASMDKPTLLLLSKMMVNKDEFMRAAGCFAVGEVASHYKIVNPVLMQSNEILQKQIQRVTELIKDENEMVRRQAERAKIKISA